MGTTIDDNYFATDPASVYKEQINGLNDKISKLASSLPLAHLLEFDKVNAKPRYRTNFSLDKHDWQSRTVINTGEKIKLLIYEIGTLKVEVEYIAQYDLVAQV